MNLVDNHPSGPSATRHLEHAQLRQLPALTDAPEIHSHESRAPIDVARQIEDLHDDIRRQLTEIEQVYQYAPVGLVLMDMTVAVTTMTYLDVARPWQISIRRRLAIHGLSLGRRCEIIAG